MNYSNYLNLSLPSRDNTKDLADINVISENFEIIDNEFEKVYNKFENTGVINTVSGNPIVLRDSVNAPLKNLRLFGKTTQNGTPTPSAPIPLVSVGDSGSFTVKIQGENVEEQSLTMPYTLRGVGDIKDELDFNRGVFIQKCVSVTGFSQIGTNTNTKTLWKKIDYNMVNDNNKALCSHTNNYAHHPNDNVHFYVESTGATVYVPLDVDASSVEVIATLETPQEIPLTESELNAYRQLHTNKPTSTILSEADMEVSYVADTKLYIDNKIAELTALTLEV